MSTGFRYLTTFTAGWLLLLTFVGAIVRVTGAGLECLTWPLCYDQMISPLQLKSWIALTHQIVAGVATILTLLIVGIAWLRYRRHPYIYKPSLIAMMLIFGQAGLGAMAVWGYYHPVVVTLHLLMTMAYLAVILFITTMAHLSPQQIKGISDESHRYYFRFLLWTGVGILLLLVSGTVVKGTTTGLACPDWPLCQGEIFPTTMNWDVMIHLLHRFSVVAIGVLIAGVILQTRRRFAISPQLTRWASILGSLYLVQIGAGGLNVFLRLPYPINAFHMLLSAAIWGSLVVLMTIFYVQAHALPIERMRPTSEATTLTRRQKAGVYFKLTKPWVLVLLLLTTITAMFIADTSTPSLSLILYTLLGGMLSAGGASVLNSYVDSDIDQIMSRTSRRATVTGLITPHETLIFGLTLSVLSFIIYANFVNMLSAILSTIGIIYYVFFYTLYLKRSTIHNIVIGGAAGAIPPLVGWTAVTNSLDLGAFYLFAIIFFWTPPHTWALALMVKKDYAQAKVPMLPVIVGEKETTYQIFLYTILTVLLTLLPFTFQMTSIFYLIVASLLGFRFLHMAWKLWRNYEKSYSRKLYKYSQSYLALLFLVMAIDRTFLF